jgi:2-oxoglutarate ferredoxin oxidoreductase subunit gamma
VTATPVRDRTWTVLHEVIERVAALHGEPVVLSTLAHAPGDDHPHTHYPFVLGPPGRLVAMAIGLRAALPTSPLLLVGAADAVTIGTNHLIHAARRNIGMTLVLLRDDIFDPGESASLDRSGYQHSIGPEQTAKPLEWASALGATFVGRASLSDVDGLTDMVEQAVSSRGFSVVGVTNDASLPAGVLTRTDWPEFFGTYRGWSDTVAPTQPGGCGAVVAAGAPTRIEVRIAGLGGQGVKLAGTCLSEAAAAEGLWATQIGDYGSATRGGASSVDVVLGAERITYPGADHPDVLVVLSQAALDSARGVGAGGIFIVDDRLTAPPGALSLPIVSLARQHTGGQLSAGIVALGVVAARTGWPSDRRARAVAARKVPGKAAAANVAAMRRTH